MIYLLRGFRLGYHLAVVASEFWIRWKVARLMRRLP